MTATAPAATIRRRPIRGAIFGLIAGLGLALVLIDRAVIALGTLAPIVCILIGAVLGLAWAWFGPAREVGRPPATSSTDETPRLDASTAEDVADVEGDEGT